MNVNNNLAKSKSNFRKIMKDCRNKLTADAASDRSRMICDKIIRWNIYKETRTILAYYPIGNEVDLRPVMLHALESGKILGLPRVTGKHSMAFYKVSSLGELERGWMDIMEPAKQCPVMEYLSSFLMLIPGLAFCVSQKDPQSDDTGVGRMGYGGGFYDRWLEMSEKDRWSITCGVGYDLQLRDESEMFLENHDVRLDALVTEKRLYCYKEDKRWI